MNPRIIRLIALLCYTAAGGMFAIGSNNSHLTELKDFFWVPIPLGVVFSVLAVKMQGNK